MKKSFPAELLEHLILCGSSMMISSVFVPYGQGLGRAIREVERLADKCPHDLSLRSRKTVSVALSRLKRKGLVTGSGPRKKTLWKITSAGRQHFSKMDGDRLPPKDGKTRLVVFDIPEEERSKRTWLRRRLLACGYFPIQKSVWAGERMLPEKLRQELKTMGIAQCVHILGLEDKRVVGF